MRGACRALFFTEKDIERTLKLGILHIPSYPSKRLPTTAYLLGTVTHVTFAN